uniref:Uncharacterized protein n=1 Tax=Trichobilharzia regenti TaxID=157069 RepID=A0AA85JA11_TRIRE
EYKKALEEDTAFNYKVLASKQLYNLMKKHISKKWENRKNLDISEGTFLEETSDSLKNDEAKLKVLETAAVRKTHEYRDTLSECIYSSSINQSTIKLWQAYYDSPFVEFGDDYV